MKDPNPPGSGKDTAEGKGVRREAEEGYEWAVLLDLSKYFDTLNHEKLLLEETENQYREKSHIIRKAHTRRIL